MWNATPNAIPESDIRNDHLRALQAAIDDFDEYSCGRGEVFKALNYFTARCDNKVGVALFLKGMRDNNERDLIDGLSFIKRQFGIGRKY